jgi:hypothetical protein
MGREVLVDSRVGNISSSNWSCLIRFIAYVLHPLIWLVMKLHSQILCKWIPIYYLLKKLFIKFSTNGFPYIFFTQELFFSNFLQIGTQIFFFQDLYETTSYKSDSWTNQICSKLNNIDPSLKLHQKLFFSNKSIASQPNCCAPQGRRLQLSLSPYS